MIPHYTVKSTPSTNLLAKELLAKGFTFFAVSAEEQTAGKGRFGNQWISPPGENVYLTIVSPIYPPLSPHAFAIISAIGLQEFLLAMGIKASLKWPNDILVGTKKIAGILIETTMSSKSSYGIIGIGLNCNLDEKTKALISQPATSIFEETGTYTSAKTTCHYLIIKMVQMIEEAQTNLQSITSLYVKNLSYLIGQNISYRTATGKKTGTVIEISDTGGLTVLDPMGKINTILSCTDLLDS